MRGTRDIIGHRTMIDRLWDAAARDVLHHAFLFEGPRGVGKHLVAVRLAMAANCTDPVPERPCGACPTCRQIEAGTHPDVVTLGPSEEHATPVISVAQVREIVRKAQYHRFNAQRRFFIVDPAEAMADAAANALLKTLEEPTPGTGFILVANHATALLPTIVSRAQRVQFAPVPLADLEAWLRSRRVEHADLVARAAMGCPGRALKLAGGALKKRNIQRDKLVELIEGPLEGHFAFSQKVCRGSRRDWAPRVEVLLAHLEDLLRDVVIVGAGSDRPLLNADRVDLVSRWTEALWPGGVVTCTGALELARENLERNVSGRTIIEAVTARFATELGRL